MTTTKEHINSPATEPPKGKSVNHLKKFKIVILRKLNEIFNYLVMKGKDRMLILLISCVKFWIAEYLRELFRKYKYFFSISTRFLIIYIAI
jgi:hypothetical protein